MQVDGFSSSIPQNNFGLGTGLGWPYLTAASEVVNACEFWCGLFSASNKVSGQVGSRAALARVQHSATATFGAPERGLKPRDYILVRALVMAQSDSGGVPKAT